MLCRNVKDKIRENSTFSMNFTDSVHTKVMHLSVISGIEVVGMYTKT